MLNYLQLFFLFLFIIFQFQENETFLTNFYLFLNLFWLSTHSFILVFFKVFSKVKLMSCFSLSFKCFITSSFLLRYFLYLISWDFLSNKYRFYFSDKYFKNLRIMKMSISILMIFIFWKLNTNPNVFSNRVYPTGANSLAIY